MLSGRAVVALCRPARRERRRSPPRLSLAEREEISRGLAAWRPGGPCGRSPAGWGVPRLLAGALGLDGPAGELFVAAARGRAPAGQVLAARPGAEPGTFAAAATRALPRDTASFTGRQAELARLLGVIDTTAASGGVIGIHAIDGMAGIGKTTLAVHAAHRLAERFPDGQFFLPLHAHTAGRRPVDRRMLWSACF
jgi:hypothetical protein